ncbi:AMP-binding protein [Streptosporangium lutulentum]
MRLGDTLHPITTENEHVPIPAVFPGRSASPARTLLDILDQTTRRHPHAPALDDGRIRLDYTGLRAEVDRLAAELREAEVGRGDRVGVRVPSGTVGLYVAILAVLTVGAAYVPVDADDPDERAELVFTEAGVRVVVVDGEKIIPFGFPPHADDVRPDPAYLTDPGDVRLDLTHLTRTGDARTDSATLSLTGGAGPGLDDDAWIIFTSGSTGKPKGVAVTHRNAAAFVDAEARLFLTDDPIGPGDRVLAGPRWPSTPPARRCGWPGGTAPAWSPPPGRWCARAWTWGRG